MTSECSVCCESSSSFPSPGCLTCTHGNDVCTACHTAFLNETRRLVQLPDGAVAVACMATDCDGAYTTDALVALLADAPSAVRAGVFARLCERFIVLQPNVRVCTRASCGATIAYEPLDGLSCPSIVCSRCANAMCVACMQDAHDDLTCDQYEERCAKGAWTSEKLINAISRRCPKCAIRVLREGGCPHMTCSRCAHQFCYGCLGDRATYRSGQHANCSVVAAQFEDAAVRLLKQIKLAEKQRQRDLLIAERAARREKALRERSERRARGELVDDDDDEDGDDLATFNPWLVFDSVSEATETAQPTAPPTAPQTAPQTADDADVLLRGLFDDIIVGDNDVETAAAAVAEVADDDLVAFNPWLVFESVSQQAAQPPAQAEPDALQFLYDIVASVRRRLLSMSA